MMNISFIETIQSEGIGVKIFCEICFSTDKNEMNVW